MSTRPSYNNSRVDQNTTPAVNNIRSNTDVNTGRTNINQSQAPGVRSSTNPSISTGQIRSGTSAPTYSVPARRSTDMGSMPSRSVNSSGGGFSSGSGSMSSGGSSSGGGSSSSGSSSSSSSSSGGTRR